MEQPQVSSYIPPAVAAPAVAATAPAAGQASVIVETVGDWLVCEDGAGHFYYHNPTQQSFDNAPPEFLAMFPGGYAPPPLGAFASANIITAAPVVESFPP